MEKNFWTEENKIMNYDNLFRADMQNKLLKMNNQVVMSKDIPDLCYNYDYFIGQKGDAVQFISDYAEEFVKSLRRYRDNVDKPFPNVQNPMRMVSLMALYAGKDIIGASEYMKERGDNKFPLNSRNLDLIIKDINGPEQRKEPRVTEKTLITKEDLTQLCLEYMRDGLNAVFEKNGAVPLQHALSALPAPKLTEQMIKSMLKNSYDDIAAVVTNTPGIVLHDLLSFGADVVYTAAHDMMREEFDINEVKVDKEFLNNFQKIVEERQIHPKINFHPEKKVEEKSMLRDRAQKRDNRENPREK